MIELTPEEAALLVVVVVVAVAVERSVKGVAAAATEPRASGGTAGADRAFRHSTPFPLERPPSELIRLYWYECVTVSTIVQEDPVPYCD